MADPLGYCADHDCEIILEERDELRDECTDMRQECDTLRNLLRRTRDAWQDQAAMGTEGDPLVAEVRQALGEKP